MVNWKFWERGDSELGLPSMTSSPTGLDFGQHYEPPPGDAFGSPAGMPSLSAPGQFPTPSLSTPLSQSQFGQSNPSPFQPSAFGQMQAHQGVDDSSAPQGGGHTSKDLEIITAKLDAIRAQLETLGIRLSTIEQRLPPAQGSDPQTPRRPWY